MKKIGIGYFADGPWSHLAFEKLIKDESIELKFIIPRINSKDNKLNFYSKEFNIPFHQGVKINSDEFFRLASKYNCDLFVSMSFDQIFKKRILELPRLKTINCHASKLPFYRGRNVLNWVLINDEKEFGITVHYVDEDIDTGDIILQKTYPISEADDYGTLLNKAYVGCAESLYEAIKKIQNKTAIRTKQSNIHPTGSYVGKREPGDEIINWNKKSREIFNFVRALCYPGPKATTILKNKLIKINKAVLIKDAPEYISIPGQILGRTLKGYLVKTSDSFIEILEIDTDCELKVGDRLG